MPETLPAGITNGPLTAFSDQGASNPGPFSPRAGSVPSLRTRSDGVDARPGVRVGSNFWVDVQVSDTPPADYAGLLPLVAQLPQRHQWDPLSIDTFTQTTGTMFSLSSRARLDNIWFYSPAGVSGAAASTQIWNANTQTLVPGTNLAASWSGVSRKRMDRQFVRGRRHRATGRKLHRHRLQRLGPEFYRRSRGYFGAYDGVTGPGANGLTNGPLSSPSNANAFNPPGGNCCISRRAPRPRTRTAGTPRRR